MNIWPFNRAQKRADRELAQQKANLAKQLENYVPADDETQTTFTDIDFGDGPVKVSKITITSQVYADPWSEMDAKGTSQWLKDEKRAKR